MGVAAIEAFKGKAKGKGKKGKSKEQSGNTWSQDWQDDRGDHRWFDRGDDWRDDQWGWNREWHGDARGRERSAHRRSDNDSWDVRGCLHLAIVLVVCLWIVLDLLLAVRFSTSLWEPTTSPILTRVIWYTATLQDR